MTMSVHQYLCLTDNYGALIHDSTTGATACVDAPEAGPTFAALQERGWTLSDVLLTHHHADHIQGVPELKAKFPNLRVWGPAKDAARIPFLDQRVVEGDLARVGSLAAKVIETPGIRSGTSPIISTTTKSPFAATRCSLSDAGESSRRPTRSCGARS